MMTKQQIKWASQHDWFIGEIEHGEYKAVIVRDYHPSGKEFFPTYSDFDKLQKWAGYSAYWG